MSRGNTVRSASSARKSATTRMITPGQPSPTLHQFPGMYQKSLWDEIGMLPDTWEDLRIGGAKLKAKGHPVGCSLGHSNDPNTDAGAVCCGATAQPSRTRPARTIVLDSKAAIEAVKYVAALYKDAMTTRCCRGMTPAITSISIPASAHSSSIRSRPIGRRRQLNKKFADDIFVIKPPKGPGPPAHGCCLRTLTASGNSPRTRKRRSSSSNITPTTGRKPLRRARLQ